MLSSALARRVAALEAKARPTNPFKCNPEYLAAISTEDLEFVASIRIDDPDWPVPGAHHGPVYVDYEATTDAERDRLSDILRRMQHGPDA